MDTSLQAEIAYRASLGHTPYTLSALTQRLKTLGYKLDRSADCKSRARYLSGPRAGESYPVITTGVKEIDTGLSFANVEARRDENFRELQALRFSEELFAVVRGHILEI